MEVETATTQLAGYNSNYEANGRVKRMPDPAEKMRLAILRITEALHMLELKYDVSWESFKAFTSQQVDLDLDIDEIGRRIDSDIYHRYLNNSLRSRDLKIWLDELDKWERSYIKAINLYEKKKRGEYFEVLA